MSAVCQSLCVSVYLSVCLSVSHCVCVCVCLSICLSGSQHFLVVTLGYVSQGTSVFLGILPFWCVIWTLLVQNNIQKHKTSSQGRGIGKTIMLHDSVWQNKIKQEAKVGLYCSSKKQQQAD